MTYPTLMVHLELGKSNAGLLNIAGDLAGRFRAGVIGVAACQPMQIPYGDVYYSGDLIEQDRRTDDKDAAEAEAEFRALLGPRVTDLHWRSAITMEPLCDYFAREARAADLILTAMDRRSLDGDSRRTNIGDLVMRAGRPVLIVPGDGEQLKLDRVFVAWKETREARRAILDALPLLRIASHVTLVEVAQEDDLAAARAHLADVAGWLAKHGIQADPLAVATRGTDVAMLAKLADDQGADIIVAGAYGHSRLREWVLGGVTHDLLLGTPRFAFLSH